MKDSCRWQGGASPGNKICGLEVSRLHRHQAAEPTGSHAMTLCALDGKHRSAGLSIFSVGFCIQIGYAKETER